MHVATDEHTNCGGRPYDYLLDGLFDKISSLIINLEITKMVRIVLLGAVINMALICNGCASTMSKLNRRPFADKVGLIAFKGAGLSGAKSVGPIDHQFCKKLWLGFIGGQPKFEDVKNDLLKKNKLAYLTKVTSMEYAESGFLGPNYCLSLKGEGFR